MNEEHEIIYILINEAMPGYVKVGRTIDLAQRLRDLYTTPVPLPFECFYAARVEKGKRVEQHLHDAFADHRVSSGREFFEIAPERVAAALRMVELEDVTPCEDYTETEEDKAALNEARRRRAVFNFKMVDIPVGATLTFARDKEKVCRVVDSRNVEFEGETMSLSESARRILENMGYHWKAVQGPLYWEYEGETLEERRKRMEEE